MRAAKVQASLRIGAVSPEPSLLAHTRGTFRQKARSLAPLNGWACAVNICHDGMLEDTNSLDGAHVVIVKVLCKVCKICGAEKLLTSLFGITLNSGRHDLTSVEYYIDQSGYLFIPDVITLSIDVHGCMKPVHLRKVSGKCKYRVKTVMLISFANRMPVRIDRLMCLSSGNKNFYLREVLIQMFYCCK